MTLELSTPKLLGYVSIIHSIHSHLALTADVVCKPYIYHMRIYYTSICVYVNGIHEYK